MIKYKTHKDDIPFIGGCLQGYVEADYKELKKLFGLPTIGDGYKLDAEWSILFEDGSSATIYNWKNGRNYNGRSGTPKTQIRNWHIGGENQDAFVHIRKLLKSVRQYKSN